jgi:hypothetical protein
MNTFDVHASMNNLLQMNRPQEEANRIPLQHQTSNAVVHQEEVDKRIERPNQPDQPEGKNVDSGSHKRYQREQAKRKRVEKKKVSRRSASDGAGRFVDITV